MNIKGQEIDQLISGVIQASRCIYFKPMLSSQVPLEFADRLSQDLGNKVYIKREDKVDDFGCGNKLRKLNYIIQHVKEKNFDTLVTMGSLPSNQCKAVAKLASNNNIRAHLIYGGDVQNKPIAAQGSYLITSMYDPTISWFENSPWQSLEEKLPQILANEKANGYNPYVIRSGASEWPGMLGSIELGIELAKQLIANNIEKADIVCAVGSSGTAVGIQIVAEIFDLDYKIHGMCIGEPSAPMSLKAMKLRVDTYAALSLTPKPMKEFQLYDLGLGLAYDHPTFLELNIMKEAIVKYNLILDHNYMLKAFIGMKKLVSSNGTRNGSTLVLIHSGGQTGVFDGNQEFLKWHEKNYKKWII